MTNDLISRSELKKALELIASTDNYHYPSWYKKVFRIIDNAPTVNAYTEEQVQEIREEVVKQFIDTPKRQKGEWIVVNQDSEGIHEIECPFCHYSKGSDFSSILTVTFEKFPPFCEKCGAELRGVEDDTARA